ncbi:MAG: SDR family NAD(P)-dependent oxidoreductase [Desulfobaccales bacterium]
MQIMETVFRDRVVMVTGAAGSVGQELVRQLIPLGPAEIRMMDNNESELFLLSERYRPQNNVTAFLGDVRDHQKVAAVAHGSDIILHCAAYKHVFFSEYNPFEAVQTNILGVKNVIEAAIGIGTGLVIFTSSDKAVNPTSVMGTSKLMGERLITAANAVRHNPGQRFSSVRFGNVIGSRGSVFQVFTEQIKQGGPVTVTDPGMTRFIMPLARAAQLVLQGAVLARGGEVMVTKMQVISIMDLAQVMIELLAPYSGHDPNSINIKLIGAKPGEKMYEELISLEELGRCLELAEMFVILPAFRSIYHDIDYTYAAATGQPLAHPYNSSQELAMSKAEIKAFLCNHRLLPEDLTPSVADTRMGACVS